MSREGGVVYKSQVSAIQRFDAETQCKIYDAFFAYLFDGIEPDANTDPIVLSLLDVFKPQIDANNKRYENGKKGGRKPKAKEPNANQAETEPKPKRNRTRTKAEPKPTETKEPVLVQGELYPQLAARSIYAPSIEDIKEFAALKGLNINAEEFYYHYDALNWKLGGTNVDWRKLVMSWGAGRKEKQQPKKIQNTVTGSVFADVFLKDGEKNGN